GVIRLGGRSDPASGDERGRIIPLGGWVVEGERPGVAAEVLDPAESDLLVVVVALAGPGAQVAEPAAPPDRDLLEGRVGPRGTVVRAAPRATGADRAARRHRGGSDRD